MLDLILRGEPMIDPHGKAMPRIMEDSRGNRVYQLGIDIGNHWGKGAMMNATTSTIAFHRTPAAYTPARAATAGETPRMFRVNIHNGSGFGEWFWIGANAIERNGDLLAIGSTAERYLDPRQLNYLAAFVVETLINAGQQSDGALMHLHLGLGIPNDEVGEDGIVPKTKEVLQGKLTGRMFTVEVKDPRLGTRTWNLHIDLSSFAQSMGSYFLWARNPSGVPVHCAAEKIIVIDVGGGHLLKLEVTPQPFSAYGDIVGHGISSIAQTLRESLSKEELPYRTMRLTRAEATAALISGKIRIGGVPRPLPERVQQVVASQLQTIIGQIHAEFQNTRNFIIWTGGGTAMLHNQIEAHARANGRAPDSFLVLPETVASLANAGGLLAAGMMKFQHKNQQMARAS